MEQDQQGPLSPLNTNKFATFQTQIPNINPPINSPVTPKQSYLKYLVALVVILLLGGLAYYLLTKSHVFSEKAQYNENNFLSGIMEKIGEMKSSTYSASVSLNVSPRDKDAKPFVTKVSNTDDLREKYQNDSARARDISSIIWTLKSSKKIPDTVEQIYTDPNNTGFYYGSNRSVKDPKTNQNYKYKLIDNGKDFELTVDFETNEAINSIKKYNNLYAGKDTVPAYGYSATSTTITGNSVTFRKDSVYGFYIPTEPPQPLLVQMSEGLKMLPKDVSASLAFSATVDKQKENTDWLFNFDAKGDFGDLTYRVNADASKVGKDYYFKVNNIPSLLGDLSSLKGQWIKVSASYLNSSSTQGGYSSTVSYLSKSLPDYEKEYKKNRERNQKMMTLAVKTAEETNLITFNGNPASVEIDGVKLMKYEVKFKKDSILEFYKKFTEAVKNDKDLYPDYSNTLDDQGMLEYLESQEFSDVFDYFDKNTTLTFWINNQGFVEKVEEKLRIVPPDTALQLKDSQINLIFDLQLSKINESVNIEVPKDYKTIEDVIKSLEKNYTSSSSNAVLASLKANLSNSRVEAELVYDKVKGYGTKSFKLGPCKKTPNTLFGDDVMFKAITSATNNKPETATCSSDTKSWAISAPYPDNSKYSWCVDGNGANKQISGSIKGNTCN